MPWFEYVWPRAVVSKIEERGITIGEVHELIENARERDIERSDRTGLPMLRGEVSTGRYLVVVFCYVDELTIQVVTAFTPDRD